MRNGVCFEPGLKCEDKAPTEIRQVDSHRLLESHDTNQASAEAAWYQAVVYEYMKRYARYAEEQLGLTTLIPPRAPQPIHKSSTLLYTSDISSASVFFIKSIGSATILFELAHRYAEFVQMTLYTLDNMGEDSVALACCCVMTHPCL